MLFKKGKRILSILTVFIMIFGLSLTVAADAFVAIEGLGTFTKYVYDGSSGNFSPDPNLSRYSAMVQADMLANGNLRLYVDISRIRGTEPPKRIIINKTLSRTADQNGQYFDSSTSEVDLHYIVANILTKINGETSLVQILIFDNLPYTYFSDDPSLPPVDLISLGYPDGENFTSILMLVANKSVLKSLKNYQNSQFNQR